MIDPLARARRRRPTPEKAGQLKAADPFDLIRLLARSQHDPRKAVAELVQNSFDAGAKRVVITRYQRRGSRTLSIWDDGEGVLPELDRQQALTYIATHIGHSRKCDLSPEQRYQLFLQGKYGIGLLGFWCVGKVLLMRSKFGTDPVGVLRLEEDSSRYEIHKERRLLDLGQRFTEVLVIDLHEAASRQLAGRRLADYLAEELRGQLLIRDVELVIIDRLARGGAQRDFQVTPRRFRGVLVQEIQHLDLEGHQGARVELYYLSPDLQETGHVALTSGGTVVVDDLASLVGFGLVPSPWTSGRFDGLVECPELDVPPGTRRGFVPNAAAEALFRAMRAQRPVLEAVLDRFEEERRKESDKVLLKQLRRIFRGLRETLPHYDLFDVRSSALLEKSMNPDENAGAHLSHLPADAEALAIFDQTHETMHHKDEPELFPPGPLATVEIHPARASISPNHARPFHAVARDSDKQRIREGVAFSWSIVDGTDLATLTALALPGESPSDDRSNSNALDSCTTIHNSSRVQLWASDRCEGMVTLTLTGEAKGAQATATAAINIVEDLASSTRRQSGLPEPQPFYDPSGNWRSRMNGDRWEFNSGHTDYLSTVGNDKRKLRYVASLLAKELVLKRFQMPNAGMLLEEMLEILSWIEGKISAKA